MGGLPRSGDSLERAFRGPVRGLAGGPGVGRGACAGRVSSAAQQSGSVVSVSRGVAWVIGVALGVTVSLAIPADDDPPPQADIARPAQESAVDVALLYVRVVGSPSMYDDATRGEALSEVLADPDGQHARLLDKGFRSAALTMGIGPDGSAGGGELVARMVPVGVRVVEHGVDDAVVAVWCLGLLGTAGADTALSVQQSWSTETVRLQRTPSGWRVAAATHADGPAPVTAPHEPATGELLARTVEEFVEVGDAG